MHSAPFVTPFLVRIGVVCLITFCLSRASIVAQDAKPPQSGSDVDITESDPAKAIELEERLIQHARQLTFEGKRAGEGYFSKDGSLLVFQSEREPGNPFFQIYLMDLESGDVERISPGIGKTTCSWVHPDNQRVLFASTHDDPEAKAKQQEEIDLRETGQQRRYSWDYDPTFEVYVYDRKTQQYTNLTNVRGYDAEGSYSPDGKLIAFASNRRAYEGEMTEREKEMFEIDPAYMMDIYLMNADGSSVRQLTDVPGYDGGPFFSPDGSRICWRRFSENGAMAEIYSMNVDGSDQRRLTQLEAMSWAPYFHPSGEYLIFATNRHGFANFELYLVDAAGKSDPVRVTHTAGFDGLPVFSPDGTKIVWTSNRTSNDQSQLFIGDWDHEQARQLLRLDEVAKEEPTEEARLAAESASAAATAGFSDLDVMRHVDYLCRGELGGRFTGTRGEKLATAYVAEYFDRLGLKPAGDNGTWFQEFEFTSGVSLGKSNRLNAGDQNYSLNESWRPVAFSANGEVEDSPVAFAGYGIRAPANDDFEAYDSYVHTDVKDKWVIILRFMPENITPELRQHLNYHASPRYKAMVARDLGAKGVIFVSGPTSKVREELIPLGLDGTAAGTSMPVISVNDEIAEQWLASAKKDLRAIQEKLDSGDMVMGFDIPKLTLSAQIDIQQVRTKGRNVVGRLQVGDQPAEEAVLVGAHIDHLGAGSNSSSLAKEEERGGVHYGADDNASGVAGMLEIAQYLVDQHKTGKLPAKRDLLFAAWSGEELGTIGSGYFATELLESIATHPTSSDNEESGKASATLHPHIAACLNMDMIGRLREKLILQGIGSSSVWKSEIERRNAPVGLSIVLQNDCFLPTDATEFYTRGVPILSAFTGQHEEYHTPRDTPEKLNYEGTAQVAKLMGLIARSLAMRDEAPDYIAQVASEDRDRRANLRAWLGTVPEYTAGDSPGVALSGVSKDGPADKAGVQAGDVIVELAGRKIENIYDYTYALEALKIGEAVKMAVMRDGKRVDVQIVPGSRE